MIDLAGLGAVCFLVSFLLFLLWLHEVLEDRARRRRDQAHPMKENRWL